jgi:hypothetical protein
VTGHTFDIILQRPCRLEKERVTGVLSRRDWKS